MSYGFQAKFIIDSLDPNNTKDIKRIFPIASIDEVFEILDLLNKRWVVRLIIGLRLEEADFGKGFTDYLLSDKGEEAKWSFYQSCFDWIQRVYGSVSRELRKLLKPYRPDPTRLLPKKKIEQAISWDDKRHDIDILVIEYFDRKFGFDFSQALEKLELKNWFKKDITGFLTSKDREGIEDRKRRFYIKALLLFLKDVRGISTIILPLFEIKCPADAIRRGYLDKEQGLKDYRTTQLPVLDRVSTEWSEDHWAKKETLTPFWQKEAWSRADKILFQHWKNLGSPLEQEERLIPKDDPYVTLYQDAAIISSTVRYFARNQEEFKQLIGAISILGNTSKGQFINEAEAAKKVGLKPDTFRKKLKAIKTHLKMRFPNKIK